MPASQPLPPWSLADLPTGTVTLLFTDIEGSTRLSQRLGDTRYCAVLEDHRCILRAALAEHGGREFGTEGDARFAVFVSASQAVAGAAAVQRGLAAHPWPDDPLPCAANPPAPPYRAGVAVARPPRTKSMR